MRTIRRLGAALTVTVIFMGVGAVAAFALLLGDTTPPVTTSDVAATYFTGDVVITVTASDDEGVAYIYHRLDRGVVRLYRVEGGTPQTTAPWDIDRPLSPGTHVFKYWAQDVNGNVEEQHETTFTVKTDGAAPTTTASGVGSGGWYGRAVTVRLTADDGDGIGVDTLTYRVDGGLPVTVTGSVADVAVVTEGTHTVTFAATDKLGHAEATRSLTFGIDLTPPTTTATGVVDGGWYNHALAFDLTSVDDGSGVASVTSRVDWRRAKTATGATANVELPVDTAGHMTEGAHTITFSATDVVGNVERLTALTVNIDTVRPLPKAASTSSAARGGKAALKYTVVDAVPNGGTASGKLVVKNPTGKVVKTLRYTGLPVNTALTARFSVPRTWQAGTYRFFVFAKDAAGNAQAKVAVGTVVIK